MTERTASPRSRLLNRARRAGNRRRRTWMQISVSRIYRGAIRGPRAPAEVLRDANLQLRQEAGSRAAQTPAPSLDLSRAGRPRRPVEKFRSLCLEIEIPSAVGQLGCCRI